MAISPVPIIAVILMLFSRRARVNGPSFLLGWVLGLAIVSGVAYALSDAADTASDSSASDTVSWFKIILGALSLFFAVRNWRHRPAPGAAPKMPKWMAGTDAFTPVRSIGLGVLLSSINPKNLILAIAAATGVAQLGVSTSDAAVGIVVFVVLASVTIAAPVVYYLVGGEPAQSQLDELKEWLGAHNAAVMAVLFLVFGAVLISKGLGLLSA